MAAVARVGRVRGYVVYRTMRCKHGLTDAAKLLPEDASCTSRTLSVTLTFCRIFCAGIFVSVLYVKGRTRESMSAPNIWPT